MTEETEVEVVVEDNEPVYYNPKALSLIAAISTWFSWLVLIGFILIAVAQFLVLRELGGIDQGSTWTELLANASAKNFIYANIAVPFITGLGMFITMQAAGIGLNALMEIELNQREKK